MARRRFSIAVATLCAFAFTATQAAAHTAQTPSSATIEWTGTGFEGQVDSSKRCTKNREVSIFRRGQTDELATLTSDEDGNFVAPSLPRQNGDYHAKVAKRVLKKNDDHKHTCQPGKSSRSQDALVRDCDEVTVFDGSGGDGSQAVDVDDDITVDVEGDRRFTDLDDFAQALPAFSIGPVSFGESIHIVAINGEFGGPVGLDPLYVQCSRADAGSGSAALDAAGVPPGGDQPVGVFYDETYPMPTITLSR